MTDSWPFWTTEPGSQLDLCHYCNYPIQNVWLKMSGSFFLPQITKNILNDPIFHEWTFRKNILWPDWILRNGRFKRCKSCNKLRALETRKSILHKNLTALSPKSLTLQCRKAVCVAIAVTLRSTSVSKYVGGCCASCWGLEPRPLTGILLSCQPTSRKNKIWEKKHGTETWVNHWNDKGHSWLVAQTWTPIYVRMQCKSIEWTEVEKWIY